MTRSKPPESTPRAALRRLLGDARGGITVVAALVIPVLALLTCGAIDLAAVNADHSALQDAADATALAMAKQLGVASSTGNASSPTRVAVRTLEAASGRRRCRRPTSSKAPIISHVARRKIPPNKGSSSFMTGLAWMKV